MHEPIVGTTSYCYQPGGVSVVGVICFVRQSEWCTTQISPPAKHTKKYFIIVIDY